jgi:hypothetical protein
MRFKWAKFLKILLWGDSNTANRQKRNDQQRAFRYYISFVSCICTLHIFRTYLGNLQDSKTFFHDSPTVFNHINAKTLLINLSPCYLIQPSTYLSPDDDHYSLEPDQSLLLEFPRSVRHSRPFCECVFESALRLSNSVSLSSPATMPRSLLLLKHKVSACSDIKSHKWQRFLVDILIKIDATLFFA